MKPNPEFSADSSMSFDPSEDSVQSLVPPDPWQRFEGIGFSPDGNVLGVVTSDTNTVYLFRRQPEGNFERSPFCTIGGASSRLNYPHDLSFASDGDTELLAVAQRVGAISIFKKDTATGAYGGTPEFEICGSKTKLNYSDGVAFVPPNHDYLAACNLQTDRVSFYRKTSGCEFKSRPVFVLADRSLVSPDGLAFSSGGKWLAVANHGNHTVSVFQRRRTLLGKLRYGPRPVTVIGDEGLRHPHSVAFTAAGNYLVVTNAGANYFNVYCPVWDGATLRWSQSPVLRKTVGPETVFKEVNARNKMEGGPKGIAIHGNQLALCSPEHGVKIYSFRASYASA